MKKSLLLLILFCVFFTALPLQANWEPSQRCLKTEKNGSLSTNGAVAFIGDLQRTDYWESTFLGKECNSAETEILLKQIAKEKPSELFILGDLVFLGGSKKNWEDFDMIMAPIYKNNIKVFPVVGNHEYYGFFNGLTFLQQRFPEIKNSTWYYKIIDGVLYVVLNSNESQMKKEQWKDQKKWFKNILQKYDNDKTVKAVIVMMHHPPVSKSKLKGDKKKANEDLLPVFLKSKKTVAMLSGHVHTYERIMLKTEYNNKYFIVAGGGGGSRVSLNKISQEPQDLYKAKFPRPFHFILMKKERNNLHFTVKGIEKGQKRFFILEEFDIPLPNN